MVERILKDFMSYVDDLVTFEHIYRVIMAPVELMIFDQMWFYRESSREPCLYNFILHLMYFQLPSILLAYYGGSVRFEG